MSYVTEHIIMFVIYSLGVTLAGNSQAMRRETSLPHKGFKYHDVSWVTRVESALFGFYRWNTYGFTDFTGGFYRWNTV